MFAKGYRGLTIIIVATVEQQVADMLTEIGSWEFTSWTSNMKQRTSWKYVRVFFLFKAWPQWHSSSSKAIPPKPLKLCYQLGTKYSNVQNVGEHFSLKAQTYENDIFNSPYICIHIYFYGGNVHVSIITHKGHRGQQITWNALSRSYEKSYANAGNIANTELSVWKIFSINM